MIHQYTDPLKYLHATIYFHSLLFVLFLLLSIAIMEIRVAAMFIFDNYLLLTTNTRKFVWKKREKENKLQVEQQQTSENHMSVTFFVILHINCSDCCH